MVGDTDAAQPQVVGEVEEEGEYKSRRKLVQEKLTSTVLRMTFWRRGIWFLDQFHPSRPGIALCDQFTNATIQRGQLATAMLRQGQQIGIGNLPMADKRQ